MRPVRRVAAREVARRAPRDLRGERLGVARARARPVGERGVAIQAERRGVPRERLGDQLDGARAVRRQLDPEARELEIPGRSAVGAARPPRTRASSALRWASASP